MSYQIEGEKNVSNINSSCDEKNIQLANILVQKHEKEKRTKKIPQCEPRREQTNFASFPKLTETSVL